jgi:hypothetical protein
MKDDKVDHDNGHGNDDKNMIVVNGREKPWNEKEISFEQVVVLAFGAYNNVETTVYTITYKRGHGNKPEGSMVKGEVIKVKDKMILNVTATDKS